MLEVFLWRHLSLPLGRPLDHGSFASFQTLEEHPGAWTAEERKEWTKPFRILRQALAACPVPIEEPTEEELRELCSRIESNVFGVIDSENRVIAQGVYLAAAMFNHSCTPNCIVEEGTAEVLQVSTAGPVAAGEELCISYIGNAPLAARRKALQKQYHFLCACTRCEIEKAEGSAKVSYRGGGPPTQRTNAEKKARRLEREAQKQKDKKAIATRPAE